jgi:hypothetical protein
VVRWDLVRRPVEWWYLVWWHVEWWHVVRRDLVWRHVEWWHVVGRCLGGRRLDRHVLVVGRWMALRDPSRAATR